MASRAEHRPLRELDTVAHYRRLWTGRLWWGFVGLAAPIGVTLVLVLTYLYAHGLSVPGFLQMLLGPGLGAAIVGVLAAAGFVLKSVPHMGVLMRMLGVVQQRAERAATADDVTALRAEAAEDRAEVLHHLQAQDIVLQTLMLRAGLGPREAHPEPEPAPRPDPPPWAPVPVPISDNPTASWGQSRPPAPGEFDDIIHGRRRKPVEDDDQPDYLRRP